MGWAPKIQRGRGQQQKSPFRGPQLPQRHPKGTGWILFLHAVFRTGLYVVGFTVKKSYVVSDFIPFYYCCSGRSEKIVCVFIFAFIA